MQITFSNKNITYSNETINYTDLKGAAGNKIIYDLLVFCMKNENDISFVKTEDCDPFGEKIKEILENEFNLNSSI